MCGMDKLLGGILGGGAPAPTVVRESPAADDARIQAEAAAKASEDRAATKRRRKYQSLLATGGGGDATAPDVSAPAGKATLGA